MENKAVIDFRDVRREVNAVFAQNGSDMKFENLRAIFEFNSSERNELIEDKEQQRQRVLNDINKLLRAKNKYGQAVFREQIYRDLGMEFPSANVLVEPKPPMETIVTIENKVELPVKTKKVSLGKKSQKLSKTSYRQPNRKLRLTDIVEYDGINEWTVKEWIAIATTKISPTMLVSVYPFASSFSDAYQWSVTVSQHVNAITEKHTNERIYPKFEMVWNGKTYTDPLDLAGLIAVSSNYLIWGFRYYNGDVARLKRALNDVFGVSE